MTTYLERTPTMAADYDDTPTIPFEIPPVVETTDGCTAGQRLNTVVETLVKQAEQAELPSDTDGFILGNIDSEHLVFSQETITPENGPPIEVSRLEVAAPSDNLHYYYRCTKVSEGDHTAFEFKVHEENSAGTQNAGFVGSTDAENPAELSSVATELSTKFAEKLIDVVSTKNQEGSLSNEALHDIVAPLTSPDVVPHRPLRRFFGKVAVALSSIRNPHAAA